MSLCLVSVLFFFVRRQSLFMILARASVHLSFHLASQSEFAFTRPPLFRHDIAMYKS